jgi:heme oxygenase
MTDAMERLRTDTREDHEATEATLLSRAINAGTVSREAYKAQLRAYHQVHHAIERSLEAAAKESKAVRAVVEQAGKKTPALSDDLDRLADVVALDSPALRTAVAALVRVVSPVNTAAVLGALYVLEGSSLGATVLLPKLQQALSLKKEGLSFYRGHGAETRSRWNAFGERMDQALADPASQEVAIASARATFAALRDVFDAISAAQALPSRS